jgi:hypothetical protein
MPKKATKKKVAKKKAKPAPPPVVNLNVRLSDKELALAFSGQPDDLLRRAYKQLLDDAIEVAQSQVIHRTHWTSHGALAGVTGVLEGLIIFQDSIQDKIDNAYSVLSDKEQESSVKSY